jgi:hypothetical protein
LKFATNPAANPESECKIVNSTDILFLLVVLRF